MINLAHHRTFRETEGVRFLDISVPGSNGLDLVEHSGPSVSPPNNRGAKQWYIHRHQDDWNRCIKGHRLFELFNSSWRHPHWFVMLDDHTGALHIPAGTYHRSYSGNDGSLLLNHAVRDEGYDENQEFNPTMIWKHHLHAPKYHGCTPRQVDNFIRFGVLSP